MLHPSIEIANSPAVIAESAAALSYRSVDNLTATVVGSSSQAGGEEHASPVCAACWAY